eukprot:TRINITY_DN13480_c0_g1_i4.p1 TRINITY_DN13480_c0_g1~~TRINITY_DN13480_c0_g1_i4.p1  ORF type:complete len:140 (-),score=6.07 TRINITY_DN13480_c0_g1_i4:231-650(-)
MGTSSSLPEPSPYSAPRALSQAQETENLGTPQRVETFEISSPYQLIDLLTSKLYCRLVSDGTSSLELAIEGPPPGSLGIQSSHSNNTQGGRRLTVDYIHYLDPCKEIEGCYNFHIDIKNVSLLEIRHFETYRYPRNKDT